MNKNNPLKRKIKEKKVVCTNIKDKRVLVEKIMHKKLYDFLIIHEILFHNQFGFQKNNSSSKWMA